MYLWANTNTKVPQHRMENKMPQQNIVYIQSLGTKGSCFTTSSELWAKTLVVGEVRAHSKCKILLYFYNLVLKAYYGGFQRGLVSEHTFLSFL